MAITSRDQLIAAMSGSNSYTAAFHKSIPSAVTTRLTSLWITTTVLPGVGSTPTSTPTACTSTTPGALSVPTVATSGNTLYLIQLSCQLSSVITTLFDRAAHVGGLIGTSAAAQTVNLSAPARFASTAGVLAYLEVYTAAGSTPASATISYTNAAGVAGRTGTALSPVVGTAGTFAPFSLQAGDTGVSSVQSLTLSATTGTAGNLGVTLAKPLHTLANGGFALARRNHTSLLDLTVSPCLFLGGVFASANEVRGLYTVAEG